jgi:hypothetical protein
VASFRDILAGVREKSRHFDEQQSRPAPIVDGEAFPIVRTAKISKEAATILVEVQKCLSSRFKTPALRSLTRFSHRILSRRPAIGIKSSSVACFIFGLLLPNGNLRTTVDSPISGFQPSSQTAETAIQTISPDPAAP